MYTRSWLRVQTHDLLSGYCDSGHKKRMNKPSGTDHEWSLSSSEFVWHVQDRSPVHALVAKPILKSLQGNGARHVLDLGCGNGAFTGLLSEHGYAVEGIDGSGSGLQLATQSYPHIAFHQQDLSAELPLRFRERFDAVVSVEVIEHLLLPRLLIDNAWRALKPGGLLILTTPYHGYWKNLAIALCGGFDKHWHPLRDFGHVKFFSKPTIRALLEEFHFQGITIMTVGRIPSLAHSMIVSAIRMHAPQALRDPHVRQDEGPHDRRVR
jgi:SAM-dependent methyltransferase